MIYLDNAATSYPKPLKVYEDMRTCMRDYCANPGRGGHRMSIESGRAVMKAREQVSGFFDINNPMQLCFTKNATEALNMGIFGFLKPNSHVITSSMEHNSVMRPLRFLEKNLGIKITLVKGNEFGQTDPDDYRKALTPKTSMIISTFSSNVNGILMPVTEIGKIASEKGICFLLDASQGAGAIPIDVEAMKIDMLAFPGHKGLLGPQGTGGLYVREGIKLNPLLHGGTGSSSEDMFQPDLMPDMLESGTLNTPGIVGLGSGIECITGFGMEKIRNHKHSLIERLHQGVEGLKGIKIYSRNDFYNNSGILAFTFEGMDSNEISRILDMKYNIASRSGLHCSPSAHASLGTLKQGMVRLSPGCFNTEEEITAAVKALQEISMIK